MIKKTILYGSLILGASNIAVASYQNEAMERYLGYSAEHAFAQGQVIEQEDCSTCGTVVTAVLYEHKIFKQDHSCNNKPVFKGYYTVTADKKVVIGHENQTVKYFIVPEDSNPVFTELLRLNEMLKRK